MYVCNPRRLFFLSQNNSEILINNSAFLITRNVSEIPEISEITQKFPMTFQFSSNFNLTFIKWKKWANQKFEIQFEHNFIISKNTSYIFLWNDHNI